jgi:hypothetical protein
MTVVGSPHPREPGLLFDQAGRRLGRQADEPITISKDLADGLSRVDRFNFEPPEPLEFQSRAAPRVYPTPEKGVILTGLLGHTAFHRNRGFIRNGSGIMLTST